jgi:small conductance mechanosensitive channel
MDGILSDVWSAIRDFGATYGMRILGAVVIFIIGRWVAKGIASAVKRLMTRGDMDPMLVGFVRNLVYFLVLIFVILAALNNLGIQTTSFIAILGAAGLAVGLALQGTLSNFGAGVLLIIFKPFKVGDFVDAGGAMGSVEKVSIFNTWLNTPDNRLVIVPNSSVIGGNITNFTAKDVRRLDLVFGVSYEDDMKQVKEEIWDILKTDERVLKEPAPTVAVLELADSSVNFAVRPWVKTSQYWDLYFDLHERIKARFDQKGISIPFPQNDVHLFPVQEVASSG